MKYLYPDAGMEIKFSVGTLALCEKRSGTRLVRDLAKDRRSARVLVGDLGLRMLGSWQAADQRAS